MRMHLQTLHRTVLILLLPLVAAGCGKREVVAEVGPEELFQRGSDAYEAERWDRAIENFERIVLRHPGFERYDEARYLEAASYFGKKEFVQAAEMFARVAADLPRSEFADDARFKACQAYERLSPIVQRDQQYTRAALDHCRAFIAAHPASEFAAEAQEIIRSMTEKLARKVYIGGEFYFERDAYDSAIIYYQDLLRSYPDAAIAPAALLRLVQANRAIGYLDEARSARERLLARFPESPEAEEARAIPLEES